MAAIAQLHKSLLAEWAKEPKNVDAVEKLVIQMRDQLSAAPGNADNSTQVIHKDLYEISTLVAVQKGDMGSFEDSIQLVLNFYEMFPNFSDNQMLMVGLRLMFLLASGKRLSDFHMLLEKVPQAVRLSNPYISTPVGLEQSIMEGAYTKVVLAEKNIPSPYYAIFIRMLKDIVRANIAVSIEKAYKLISTCDATHMLLFDKPAEVVEYAKQRSWKHDNGWFVFDAEPVSQTQEKQQLDTVRIAKQVISYAKQLEMIV